MSETDTEAAAPPVPPAAPAPGARHRTWLRIGILAAVTVALVAGAHLSGLGEHLTQERIQRVMSELGVLGFVAFVALFTLGELVHVPGVVFVLAAVVAYGPWLGFGAGLLGAIISLSIAFWVVRLIGGQPLAEVQRPFVRRMLARLDRHPVRTIAILRVLFQMLPALNYALAMSKVRYRDYLLGSVLGLVPVIGALALGLDAAIAWLFS